MEREDLKRLLDFKRAKYNALVEFVQSIKLDIHRNKGISIFEDLECLEYQIKILERMLQYEIF